MFSDIIDNSVGSEDNKTAFHIDSSAVLTDILGIPCVTQSDRIEVLSA